MKKKIFSIMEKRTFIIKKNLYRNKKNMKLKIKLKLID